MKMNKKLEWGVLILTAAMMLTILLSQTYSDLLITTRHGINFWDILFDGDILAFYELNQCNSGNAVYTRTMVCSYNILVYVVFAVWNLPLYLLERFAGVDVMNAIPCLVYSKLLIVAAMVVTVFLVKRILEDMDVSEKRHNLILYLYVTSTLMVSVIFTIGQYDILSLIFQLLGFSAYIRGKDKQFVFWFGIAFCFKYFAAVIFLPLLLLRHKKIFAWIKNLVMLIVPFVITRAPFIVYGMLSNDLVSAGGKGDSTAVDRLYHMLSSANASVEVNLFVIAYLGILAWCYLQNSNSSKRVYHGVWACMLSYAAFFGLMDAYPYWSILLAPFLVLTIAMAPGHFYLNVLLETMGLAALVLVNMLRYPWVYFGDTLKPMIWAHILEGTRFRVDYENSRINALVLSLSEAYDVHAVINSVLVAAVCVLAFTTYPERPGATLQKWSNEKEYADVLLVRAVVNALVCMLPVIAAFI